MVDETLVCDTCGWLRFEGDDGACPGCGQLRDAPTSFAASLPTLPPMRIAATVLALLAVVAAMAGA